MSESAGYMDIELQRIRREHHLTVPDMSRILRCDKRQTYRYLTGDLTIPSCRWRLLRLELGLERPAWTEKARQKRAVAEFIGET